LRSIYVFVLNLLFCFPYFDHDAVLSIVLYTYWGAPSTEAHLEVLVTPSTPNLRIDVYVIL